ncbi:MAG TPA: helix-turn-helix transcriptional regulator [Gemmatimonadales bacterium]|jgi:transcriptional regulator with XRE-family HTH domain|nr:helix-turn-helix transcriptional regulator [Gemmatimonadales bacterium]
MLGDRNDIEILRELGARLRAYRLQQNVPVADLARRAGLSKTTLTNLESGADFRVGSLLGVLRALGRLDTLDALLPPPVVSPLDQVREGAGPVRRRASRKRVLREAPSPPPASSAPPIFPPGTDVARIGVPKHE